MQTEKRNNNYNNPVSVKTSITELYGIVTTNISRRVSVGFFMLIHFTRMACIKGV
jgi:hypothetical protein